LTGTTVLHAFFPACRQLDWKVVDHFLQYSERTPAHETDARLSHAVATTPAVPFWEIAFLGTGVWAESQNLTTLWISVTHLVQALSSLQSRLAEDCHDRRLLGCSFPAGLVERPVRP